MLLLPENFGSSQQQQGQSSNSNSHSNSSMSLEDIVKDLATNTVQFQQETKASI